LATRDDGYHPFWKFLDEYDRSTIIRNRACGSKRFRTCDPYVLNVIVRLEKPEIQ
jgi:hypothetical protein